MKNKILSCLLFVVSLSYSQNLVPNPSFEDTISLNMSNTYLEDCINNWRGGFGYYHVNRDLFLQYYHVPNNLLGHQQPKSYSAYVGVFSYTYCSCIIRNYIQCKLKTSLSNSKKYVVRFWVSLADTQRIANNNIGALFTTDSFNVSNNGIGFIINQVPQIQNNINNNLTSKTDWTLVTDTFTANGTERWITIGNFLNDSLSNSIILDSNCTINGFNCNAYYYIDDVSVELVDETGLSPSSSMQNLGFKVMPNPSNGSFVIEGNYNVLNVSIQNTAGAMLYNKNMQPQNKRVKIDDAALAKGIYFVKVTTEYGMQCLKLVVQ